MVSIECEDVDQVEYAPHPSSPQQQIKLVDIEMKKMESNNMADSNPQKAYPPLANCLGSAAASKVPLPNLLIACPAELKPTKVIFAPMLFIKAVVWLLYPTRPFAGSAHSNSTCGG
jgi:hypothetical protein